MYHQVFVSALTATRVPIVREAFVPRNVSMVANVIVRIPALVGEDIMVEDASIANVLYHVLMADDVLASMNVDVVRHTQVSNVNHSIQDPKLPGKG